MNIAYFARNLLSNICFSVDRLAGKFQSAKIVLCYHSFTGSSNRYSVNLNIFKEKINKLSKIADFVSIEDIGLISKTKRARIVLTIDDGLSSVMDILPYTQEHNIPVTLFVLSDPKNANRHEIDSDEKFLTWAEIKKLQKAGWTIGCHSSTHANFSSLSKSEIVKEVIGSKKALEQKLGSKVDYFAYPKGSYSPLILKAVRQAGYKGAFTIEAGVITNQTNAYEIPRTIIDKTHKLSEFPSILTPSWLKLRELTNKYKLWEKFLS